MWGSSVFPRPSPFYRLWNWPRGSTVPGRGRAWEPVRYTAVTRAVSLCREAWSGWVVLFICENMFIKSHEHLNICTVKITYILSLIKSNFKGNKSIQRFTHVILIHPSNEMEMSRVDSWKTNSKTTKPSSVINKKWQSFSDQLPTATGRAQRLLGLCTCGDTVEGTGSDCSRRGCGWNTQGQRAAAATEVRAQLPQPPRHSPVPEALCSQAGRARRPHKGHSRNRCRFMWSHWLWNRVALCRSFQSINYPSTGYMSSCYHLGKESSKIPYPCLTLISSMTWKSKKLNQRRCKSTDYWDFLSISAFSWLTNWHNIYSTGDTNSVIMQEIVLI